MHPDLESFEDRWSRPRRIDSRASTQVSVKFSELLATATPPASLLTWWLTHRELINAGVQQYTLVVGAVGSTFAALYWVRRWWKNKQQKETES